MASGSLNIRLRPIKLAFLIDPRDEDAFLKAVQIATSLWGGGYFPIIPVYKRKPKVLLQSDALFKFYSNDKVFQGYISAYDPDFVVPLGKAITYGIKLQNVQVLNEADIYGSFSIDNTPAYGVGLLEIIQHLAAEELKFVRKNPLNICRPIFTSPEKAFLSSVFGTLPELVDKKVTKWSSTLDLQEPTVTVENFYELLEGKNIFMRRLANLYFDVLPKTSFKDGGCLMFMDPTSLIDVIDYWNLRALGWGVVPVPKNRYKTEGFKKMAKEFINSNYRQHRYNKTLYSRTVIQKSRSTNWDELTEFIRFLDLPAPDGSEKIISHPSYPRIWDDWARDKDGAECCQLEGETKEISISSNDSEVEFRTLTPPFMYRFGGHGDPRYVNEIDLKIYGNEELYAEVFPQGDFNLARAIGTIGHNEWHLKKGGLAYFGQYPHWRVSLPIPKADTVFLEWLRSKGWEVRTSSAGHIAQQLLKQLRGPWGISLIANEGLLKLLGNLTGYNRLLSELLRQTTKLSKLLDKKGFTDTKTAIEVFQVELEKAKMSTEIKEKSINQKHLLDELAKAIGNQKFGRDAKGYLKRLMDSNVFQLGIEVQCPTCIRTSWYSITEMKHDLKCPKCLDTFRIPSHSPETEMLWSYRPFGPFSLPDLANGSYAVLLALRFFTNYNLNSSVSPALSFEVKINSKPLEVDLGMLFKQTVWGISETKPVFVEAKSFYDSFDKKGIENMELVGKEVPGSVLVYSTLREELYPEEIKMIKSFASQSRRARLSKEGKPFNPILILTGTELFAEESPPTCWENASDKHKTLSAKYKHRFYDLLSICDATQELYLGMKPWEDEKREFFDELRTKRNKGLAS